MRGQPGLAPRWRGWLVIRGRGKWLVDNVTCRTCRARGPLPLVVQRAIVPNICTPLVGPRDVALGLHRQVDVALLKQTTFALQPASRCATCPLSSTLQRLQEGHEVALLVLRQADLEAVVVEIDHRAEIRGQAVVEI